MNESEPGISTSACRYCRFYQSQGRRGGFCEKLGVPVESNWEACTLASSPFKTTVTKLEEIFQLNSAARFAEKTSQINTKNDYSKINEHSRSQGRSWTVASEETRPSYGKSADACSTPEAASDIASSLRTDSKGSKTTDLC